MPFITVDNLHIYYEDSGSDKSEPQKPALLLLHGWGCGCDVYKKLTAHFAEKYRVIVPDLPGFGRSADSEPPSPWGVPRYADFTLAFLSELNITPDVIFAHSMGCRIAIWLMAEAGLSPGKAVFTGAAGIRHKPGRKARIKTKIFKCCRKILELLHMDKTLEKLRQHSGSADYRAASATMRGCLSLMVGQDLTDFLKLVSTETLLIWGENDDATPLQDARVMEREMPNAGLAFIKNAGHYAFLEQTALFLKITDNFL